MQFFKRSIRVQIISVSGDVKIFDSKNFTVEFTSEFGGKSPSTVKLFNVLDSTADMCRPELKGNVPVKFASVELFAGYNEEYSKLISAQIVSHEMKRSGTERILEIKAGAFASSMNQIVMNTYEFVPASEVFRDLFRKADIPNYELKLDDDLVIDRISLTGTVDKAVNDLCARTKSRMIVRYGKIIIEGNKWKLPSEIVLLSRESGLIGSPLKNGTKWKVKSLLNPMLTAGEVFELQYSPSTESVTFKDQLKIISGHHSGSNRSENFYTEFECVKA